MEITYVTTNIGKVHSLQRACDAHGWNVSQIALDLPEPRSSDVVEIAKYKAEKAYYQIWKPVVVLDAGFYIPSLNGFPRAYVNFALETIGNEGILKLLEGKDRSCEFRECLAYHDGLPAPRTFLASVRGRIAEEPRGTMRPAFWSELALIYIPEGYDRTLAELSNEEVEERRKGFTIEQSAERQFVEWLANRKVV